MRKRILRNKSWENKSWENKSWENKSWESKSWGKESWENKWILRNETWESRSWESNMAVCVVWFSSSHYLYRYILIYIYKCDFMVFWGAVLHPLYVKLCSSIWIRYILILFHIFFSLSLYIVVGVFHERIGHFSIY